MNQPKHNFAWLLHPFKQNRFLQHHWERDLLFIQRQQPHYYADLLSFRDLDSLLASSHRRLPGLRIVKAGTNIGIHRYSPGYAQIGDTLYGTVNIDRVFAEHQAGATIILDAIHRTWQPLSILCREIEALLTQPVQANLYLTPRSAQGFEAHYDTHDVFILQVAGRKKWRIFLPEIRLPLRSQPHTGDHDASRTSYRELDLVEGDLLYIPRGFVHEAMTQTDNLSAHITLGVIAYTWYDLFHEVLKEICAEDHIFRESLPPGFVCRGIPTASTKSRIRKLTRALSRYEVFTKSLDNLSNHFVSDREPILNGFLSEQLQLDKIDMTTMLAIRDGLIYRTNIDDKTVSLTFHGKSLHLPRFVAAAIHFIIVKRAFRVGAIPDCIDTVGKLVLVRRLISEGFLTTTTEH